MFVDDTVICSERMENNGNGVVECAKELKKGVQAVWDGRITMSGVSCDGRVPGNAYKTVTRSALLYNLESAALTKRQEVELEVSKKKMSRFSLGIIRMDEIKNTARERNTQDFTS